MYNNIESTFKGKTVLITGHTGFKGSWLTIWLQELGAKVIGYSLPPPTTPSLFEIARLDKTLTHIINDVRDYPKLAKVIDTHQPQIVFHLAAQALVLTSYDQPKETFDINAGGTVNLLEACRGKNFIQAIVIITTDKCYENNEWIWGYRENDPLGGSEPYSSSKAMAEIAAGAYRKAFFQGATAVATARAGNVIGGGDFSENRLMPDAMKALLNNKPIKVRNKQSVRPWIHVLDPLYGYLLLTTKLLSNGQEFAEAWNFGPMEQRAVNAKMLVEKAIECWGDGDWTDVSNPNAKPEMNVLRLNWDKAANRLGWNPTYHWEQAVEETVHWYKAFGNYSNNTNKMNMREVCVDQIHKYTQKRQQASEYEIYPNTLEGSLSHRS